MRDRNNWHWFRCTAEDCDAPNKPAVWGSEQSEPDREWCYCGSPETPEYLGCEPKLPGGSYDD